MMHSLKSPPKKEVKEICGRYGASKPERVTQTLVWAQEPIPDACWQDIAQLSYSSADPEADRVYKPG